MHRSALNHRFALAALVLAAVVGATASASAAGEHRAARNPALLDAPSAVPVVVTPPIGINTSGHNQPGVPNTSTPGIIGTGAQPSGLVGDSRTAPGFPAVGQR
ncbi:hypothetical protein [Bradyrhizobium prioriisuperbiae]|uniref:hypothetical protein n=1 Tax=Bradyrhizobium prioriisuperbiae TaxID=2854389 RepID=UPI0028EA5238|nr:hypothetical protein [Bradyrhizobium prioritasuperba]